MVTAFDVLEHVCDLALAAANIKSQLLPGGCFVFVVPVYDGALGPMVQLLDRDPTHIHKLPRAYWLRWAQKHFTVLNWRGILRYFLLSKLYIHFEMKDILKYHSPTIAVICRKEC